MAHWIVVPVIVIPAQAGMDYINHWIPACAGMTAGGFRPSPACCRQAGMTEGVDSGFRRAVEEGDDGVPPQGSSE